MPFLDTKRLRIHYQEGGAGSEAFVLVHGNFASWRWWQPVLDRLRPRWRAFAPDLRGCGETPTGEDPSAYGIAPLADDLAAFVDGLGLRTFHLVGHSLGGAVALRYALDHPDRARSLTLAAPPPPTGLSAMREGTSKSAQLLRSIDPDHGPSMAMLQSSYRLHRSLGTNRLMLRQALAEMMPAASLEPAMTEALLADAARMSSDAVVGFLRALHRWNVEAELHRLRVPTTILWGTRDVLVPRAGLEEMARLLGGELLVWPDTGHSPQLERPDQFVDLLASAGRRLLRKRFQRWFAAAMRWCTATLET